MITEPAFAAAILAITLVGAVDGKAGGERDLGEAAYQKCYACHAIEPGRSDLTGPTLHGVVGRAIAAEPGFAYSDALKAFALRNQRWTPELLDRYVADPEALVPGTEMMFTGMSSAKEREALIAFLKAHHTHIDGK